MAGSDSRMATPADRARTVLDVCGRHLFERDAIERCLGSGFPCVRPIVAVITSVSTLTPTPPNRLMPPIRPRHWQRRLRTARRSARGWCACDRPRVRPSDATAHWSAPLPRNCPGALSASQDPIKCRAGRTCAGSGNRSGLVRRRCPLRSRSPESRARWIRQR
jgi:hypothetical protein